MDDLIPVEGQQSISKSELYLQNKGWSYEKNDTQLISDCPICLKSRHFYINHTAEKDGVWDCKSCGEKGNLYQLATRLGDKLAGVSSLQEWATKDTKADPIPNIGRLHDALMADADALDYLVAERKFSIAVIESMKLGLEVGRDGGKWLVIPYFNRDNCVFVKYRTLPPAEKAFRCTQGRDVPLYNMNCLAPNMEELFFCEGEPDTLSLLSNGITNVVGVPGANTQKTLWVERIDNLKPQKIYLLYDNDKVGQKAAQEMAVKLGIEKCFNILLPEGTKDINDWFKAGHTLAEFEDLKAQARPFDVAGVSSIGNTLDELEAEIEGRGGVAPTFITPWADMNKRLGGLEPGDLVGVMAEGKVGKTTIVMNWLDYYAKNGIPSLLYCQEMSPKRLSRKWASYVTKTDDNPYASKLTAQTIRDAKAIARTYPADLLLGFTRGHKPDHVFDVIRQAVRRYGIRVVGFDNLQLLSRSISNQTAELNVLGKKFKELAMELGIVVILIIQPNRGKDGDIVAARNAAGSSAIEKDVDAMVCFHRNRIAKMKESDFTGYIETDETFEPQMMGNVDLCRYGSGGKFTLIMEGCMSWVRDYEESDKVLSPKIVGGVVPTEGMVVEV